MAGTPDWCALCEQAQRGEIPAVWHIKQGEYMAGEKVCGSCFVALLDNPLAEVLPLWLWKRQQGKKR